MARTDHTGKLLGYWEVQQETGTQRLPNGEEVKLWTKYFETFVEMMPLTGREFMNGPQTQANITHKLRVRWRDDKILTADMRLAELPAKTRLMYLAGPTLNVNERNQWWEFLAVEVVANPKVASS